MIKNLLILFLFIFLFNTVFSQETSFQEKMIRTQIPIERVQELEQAEEYIIQIETLKDKIIDNDGSIYKLQERNSTSTNKKEKKRNEKKIKELQNELQEELVKIANLYYLNYKNTYSVYRDKLNMYETTDREKRLKVNMLLEDSKQIKSKIRLIVENLEKTKNCKNLKKRVNEINLLRVEGQDKLNESFCTYINCNEPITESYKDIKIKKLEKKIRQKRYVVIFKVQILAVSTKANIDNLQKKYDLIKVEESYSNEFKVYRYSVGEFDNYYDARDYSENIEIRDSFVISYVDGKRAKIKDAIIKNEITD